MQAIFYMHATIAVLFMGSAMLTPHAVHALLFAVGSLISLAVSMYSLSAELASALLVIIYAGAIMVLFVFAIMLIRPEALVSQKVDWKNPKTSISSLVILLFFGEVLWVTKDGLGKNSSTQSVSDIAQGLFQTYGLYVEVISFVLLAGFVTTIFVAKSLNKANKAEKTT